MTLKQVIKYAITGVIKGCESEDVDKDIQELIDILNDYGNITDKRLKDLLKK
jgi:hypothetical protein